MPSPFPEITDEQIGDMVQTAPMMRAGLDYARQGRVGALDYDEEMGHITAIVRGSGTNYYFTSLVLSEHDIGIETECSCPVGYGCKHAAAVAFAMRDAAPTKPRLRIEAAPPSSTVASGAVGQWLAQIDTDDMVERLLCEPACFVIEPKRAFKKPKRPKGQPDDTPARYLLSIRPFRQRGRAGEWTPIHLWEIQQNRLQISLPALRLLARMAPEALGGDFTGDKMPRGRHGWQWLCEAAGLGLLHWKAPGGQALTIGPDNMKAEFVWRLLADGSRCLDLTGLPAGVEVGAGDPPLVIDEATATITLIDAGISPDRAGRLLAMPPIAPADIPHIAARWGELAGDAIPAPTVHTAQDIAVTPRPVLCFLIEKLDLRDTQRYWHRDSWRASPCKITRLAFDYGGHRLQAPATTPDAIIQGPEGPIRVIRELVAEQAAADRLADLSLVPLSLVGDVRLKPHQGWDHSLTKDAGDYPAFIANAVRILEAEGWLIEYGANWPHIPTPSVPADLGLALTPAPPPASVEPAAAIDWFDLELPALVGDTRIDILPALRRWLAQGGKDVLALADDHQIAIPIGKQHFTTVTLGPLRPLLASLLRLALADSAATTLRFNRYDAGVVHDLAGDGVNWTSADALRSLAAALHDPAHADYRPPEALQAQLRPYQRAGAGWLQALHSAGLGGILADDMGLGKTMQAIAHLLQTGKRPSLIVAPTSVLPNWQAELARFAPHLSCHLWHGHNRRDGAGAMAEADVILTSYPLLSRDKDILTAQEWAVTVLDEAHVLKNPVTAGFKAAAALRAGQTIALTGTPLENRLNDIWALATLTNPGLLGNFEAFRRTYRTPIEKHGDISAKTALVRRLRPFLLRRTKDQVTTELPPKTLIPERIELTEAQTRLYESQRLLMQTRVRDEIARVGLMRAQIIVLDAMLKLRQICCDPELLPGGAGTGIASAKRARLLEMIPELISEGRRVIIFSQFTAMLDRISGDLSAAGFDYEQLRGTTRDRARPVRRFQNGEVALILVSLKAGGAGINLTAADTVILYDPWWNPAVEAQAVDRAHRIGQTKPVFVHRLIATGTIEEKILALQERKQDLADLLWSAEAGGAGSALNDEDIAFLLG